MKACSLATSTHSLFSQVYYSIYEFHFSFVLFCRCVFHCFLFRTDFVRNDHVSCVFPFTVCSNCPSLINCMSFQINQLVLLFYSLLSYFLSLLICCLEARFYFCRLICLFDFLSFWHSYYCHDFGPFYPVSFDLACSEYRATWSSCSHCVSDTGLMDSTSFPFAYISAAFEPIFQRDSLIGRKLWPLLSARCYIVTHSFCRLDLVFDHPNQADYSYISSCRRRCLEMSFCAWDLQVFEQAELESGLWNHQYRSRWGSSHLYPGQVGKDSRSFWCLCGYIHRFLVDNQDAYSFETLIYEFPWWASFGAYAISEPDHAVIASELACSSTCCSATDNHQWLPSPRNRRSCGPTSSLSSNQSSIHMQFQAAHLWNSTGLSVTETSMLHPDALCAIFWNPPHSRFRPTGSAESWFDPKTLDTARVFLHL